MFSKTPYSAYPPAQKRPTNSGFTLIELLMVIVVIMVLAGITFGISRGVQNVQARALAKAELSVIAQALEGFKSTYGDYPWVSGAPTNKIAGSPVERNAEQLLLALTGFAILERDSFGNVDLEEIDSGGARKSFLDPTKVGLSQNFGDPTRADDLNGVYFTDPWGNPYAYVYAKSSTSDTWENFGYVLFTEGADSNSNSDSIKNTGILDSTHRNMGANIDNIYSGE